MELITNWLNGKRNYHVGAILFIKFGTDEALKALLTGSPTPYLQQRLEAAMQALLDKPKVVLKVVPDSQSEEMPKSADRMLEAFPTSWINMKATTLKPMLPVH